MFAYIQVVFFYVSGTDIDRYRRYHLIMVDYVQSIFIRSIQRDIYSFDSEAIIGQQHYQELSKQFHLEGI